MASTGEVPLCANRSHSSRPPPADHEIDDCQVRITLGEQTLGDDRFERQADVVALGA